MRGYGYFGFTFTRCRIHTCHSYTHTARLRLVGLLHARSRLVYCRSTQLFAFTLDCLVGYVADCTVTVTSRGYVYVPRLVYFTRLLRCGSVWFILPVPLRFTRLYTTPALVPYVYVPVVTPHRICYGLVWLLPHVYALPVTFWLRCRLRLRYAHGWILHTLRLVGWFTARLPVTFTFGSPPLPVACGWFTHAFTRCGSYRCWLLRWLPHVLPRLPTLPVTVTHGYHTRFPIPLLFGLPFLYTAVHTATLRFTFGSARFATRLPHSRLVTVVTRLPGCWVTVRLRVHTFHYHVTVTVAVTFGSTRLRLRTDFGLPVLHPVTYAFVTPHTTRCIPSTCVLHGCYAHVYAFWLGCLVTVGSLPFRLLRWLRCTYLPFGSHTLVGSLHGLLRCAVYLRLVPYGWFTHAVTVTPRLPLPLLVTWLHIPPRFAPVPAVYCRFLLRVHARFVATPRTVAGLPAVTTLRLRVVTVTYTFYLCVTAHACAVTVGLPVGLRVYRTVRCGLPRSRLRLGWLPLRFAGCGCYGYVYFGLHHVVWLPPHTFGYARTPRLHFAFTVVTVWFCLCTVRSPLCRICSPFPVTFTVTVTLPGWIVTFFVAVRCSSRIATIVDCPHTVTHAVTVAGLRCPVTVGYVADLPVTRVAGYAVYVTVTAFYHRLRSCPVHGYLGYGLRWLLRLVVQRTRARLPRVRYHGLRSCCCRFYRCGFYGLHTVPVLRLRVLPRSRITVTGLRLGSPLRCLLLQFVRGYLVYRLLTFAVYGSYGYATVMPRSGLDYHVPDWDLFTVVVTTLRTTYVTGYVYVYVYALLLRLRILRTRLRFTHVYVCTFYRLILRLRSVGLRSAGYRYMRFGCYVAVWLGYGYHVTTVTFVTVTGFYAVVGWVTVTLDTLPICRLRLPAHTFGSFTLRLRLRSRYHPTIWIAVPLRTRFTFATHVCYRYRWLICGRYVYRLVTRLIAGSAGLRGYAHATVCAVCCGWVTLRDFARTAHALRLRTRHGYAHHVWICVCDFTAFYGYARCTRTHVCGYHAVVTHWTPACPVTVRLVLPRSGSHGSTVTFVTCRITGLQLPFLRSGWLLRLVYYVGFRLVALRSVYRGSRLRFTTVCPVVGYRLRSFYHGLHIPAFGLRLLPFGLRGCWLDLVGWLYVAFRYTVPRSTRLRFHGYVYRLPPRSTVTVGYTLRLRVHLHYGCVTARWLRYTFTRSHTGYVGLPGLRLLHTVGYGSPVTTRLVYHTHTPRFAVYLRLCQFLPFRLPCRSRLRTALPGSSVGLRTVVVARFTGLHGYGLRAHRATVPVTHTSPLPRYRLRSHTPRVLGWFTCLPGWLDLPHLYAVLRFTFRTPVLDYRVCYCRLRLPAVHGSYGWITRCTCNLPVGYIHVWFTHYHLLGWFTLVGLLRLDSRITFTTRLPVCPTFTHLRFALPLFTYGYVTFGYVTLLRLRVRLPFLHAFNTFTYTFTRPTHAGWFTPFAVAVALHCCRLFTLCLRCRGFGSVALPLRCRLGWDYRFRTCHTRFCGWLRNTFGYTVTHLPHIRVLHHRVAHRGCILRCSCTHVLPPHTPGLRGYAVYGSFCRARSDSTTQFCRYTFTFLGLRLRLVLVLVHTRSAFTFRSPGCYCVTHVQLRLRLRLPTRWFVYTFRPAVTFAATTFTPLHYALPAVTLGYTRLPGLVTRLVTFTRLIYHTLDWIWFVPTVAGFCDFTHAYHGWFALHGLHTHVAHTFPFYTIYRLRTRWVTFTLGCHTTFTHVYATLRIVYIL